MRLSGRSILIVHHLARFDPRQNVICTIIEVMNVATCHLFLDWKNEESRFDVYYKTSTYFSSPVSHTCFKSYVYAEKTLSTQRITKANFLL